MFKGKVYVYRNNNGKEEEFEKEFDNPQEFDNFRKSYRQPEFEGPFMGLGDRAHLQNYFDNLINRRLGLGTMIEPEEEEQQYLPNGVNLSKYRNAIQDIEDKKAYKAEKLQKLKDTLSELKDYKKKLKDAGRDDLLKEIDNDIATTQKEIDSLEK